MRSGQFQCDKISDLSLGTFQHISVNIGCDIYIPMSKMLGHYLEVNTTVQQERSIAMPELVQGKGFKLCTFGHTF